MRSILTPIFVLSTGFNTATAVRIDDFRFALDDEVCSQTCKRSQHEQSSYEVHGEAALQMSWQLNPRAEHFIGFNCREDDADRGAVSVVPWVDAKDPVGSSFIALYMDPMVEMKFRWKDTAKLCEVNTGNNTKCLCKLSDEDSRGPRVLERIAGFMPQAAAGYILQFQFNMDRSCPSPGIPDAVGLSLMCLALVPVLAAVEAIIALRGTAFARQSSESFEVPEVPEVPDIPAFFMKTPLANFTSGASWTIGFVMSIVGLQAVALLLVNKPEVETSETRIWLIIAFPSVLAILGTYRMLNLLCKKQLEHACLQHGILLSEPSLSTHLDAFLLIYLAIYTLGILLQVSVLSLKALVIVLGALAGPGWTMMKALVNARDVETQLARVEMERLWWKSADALPEIKLLRWGSVLAAGRARKSDILKSTEAEGVEAASHSIDFQLVKDATWHRRNLWRMTGSRSGYLVLPSFLGMTCVFLGISMLQAANYACSQGQLSSLELASSLHTLDFKPWQRKYQVHIDTSFKQVALAAWADVRSTKWISIEQPAAPSGDDGNEQHLIEHLPGSSIAEIQLSRALLPRVAAVNVQGLRLSLPPTRHEVRFSPLKTLPVRVEISSGNFSAHLAWSTLPGSIISVPPGHSSFEVRVLLSDFFLGLPTNSGVRPPEDVLRWTVFEPAPHANETSCASDCWYRSDCLTHFLGHGGCFLAVNNHTHEESRDMDASVIGPAAAGNRHFSGTLTGCKLEEDKLQEVGHCSTVSAQNLWLRFGQIQPDWQSKATRLSLTVTLDVGEQRFQSESGSLNLHQGLPMPSDAFAQLLAFGDSGAKLIETETYVDDSGNVIVEIQKYDPLAIKSMELSLLPMLPDRAFNVSWTSPWRPANDIELKFMQQHGKCIHSGFARHVYAFCEKDTMHDKAIKDMPITVPLSPLTGRSEKTLHFKVTPRTNNGNHWPVPQLHEVKLIFKGVDSPAAWTAQKHGCHLVENLTLHNDTDPVLNSIVGSGDAICLLEKCSLQQACQLIDMQGLGARSNNVAYGVAGETVHPPPLLERHAIVQAIICLRNGQKCDIANTWAYQSGKLSLHGHGAQIDLNTLLETVAKFGEDGSAFLQEMKIKKVRERLQFHKDLPKATWEVSNLTAQLVTAVASLSYDMPSLLLRAFVVSKSSTGPPYNHATGSEVQDFQSAFASVKSLEVVLEDASQVERVAIALDFAPNVGFLDMVCACQQAAKEPSPDAWFHLFPHFRKLHRLAFGDLVMTNTRVGEAVEKELSAATGLKELDLGGLTTGSNSVHLARAASQLNLEKLRFWNTDGGSAGAFLKELEANPPKSLTMLKIYSNNLGPQRGLVLPQLLQKLPNLSELDISDNQLRDELGKKLATTLQGSNLRLLELFAAGNDFSEETKQKLESVCTPCALLQCKSFWCRSPSRSCAVKIEMGATWLKWSHPMAAISRWPSGVDEKIRHPGSVHDADVAVLVEELIQMMRKRQGLCEDVCLEQLSTAFMNSTLDSEPMEPSEYLDWLKREVLGKEVAIESSMMMGHMTTKLPGYMPDMSKLVTAMNLNLVKTETGKATTFLEREAIAVLHQAIFHQDVEFYQKHMQCRSSCLGVMTSGGTAANIQALWMARHRAFPAAEKRGLSDAGGAVVLTSVLAHYSMEKAMSLLGLGSENLIQVETDDAFRVNVAEMRRVAKNLEKNFKVIAIVGIAGATETGSVDDLNALADLAASLDAHFHVDAAWGFGLALTSTALHGIERADTVTVDGHKLLYTPMGCGTLLIRDPCDPHRISKSARYIIREDSFDQGRFTMEGSRPAMAIYLHMNLRCLSRTGLASRILRGCALAQRLAEMLRSSKSFELITEPPSSNILLYRYIPRRSWVMSILQSSFFVAILLLS
eukprot:symbB.v1.2.023886.t1/scaffold2222.1/size85392/2